MLGMTVRELAELAQKRGTLGKTFDYALPQVWVDMVHNTLGIWPQEYGFVWYYPDSGKGHTWGIPFPLTPEAEVIVKILEHMEKIG